MPVKILPSEIVSLIAAGEVIESPASVLKELIENSIDSGADRISVEIKKAGKELIRVSDNGSGMSKEDLRLSILRHATSKISSYEDLLNLSSYGFRGEALYSVFSVAELHIKTWNGEGGSGLILSGGGGDFKNLKITPAAPVKGTIVEVRNLFFNTPARAKFLKGDNTLKASLIKTVEEFALCQPEISISLTIDSSEIFNFPAGKDFFKTLEERLKKVFTKKTAENLIRIGYKSEKLSLYGYVSDPSNLISSRSSQYFFVNKRAVENKTASQALYRAYDEFRNGKHPACALFMETPGAELDINVHPQKKEVKFSDENFVFEAVKKTVYSEITKKQSAPSFQHQSEGTSESVAIPGLTYGRPEPAAQNSFSFSQESLPGYKVPTGPNWYKPPVKFIGQVFDSLLVFQSADSILILDQHAAVERIMFEKYSREFAENMIQIQTLLIPVQAEMTPDGAENLMRWKDWLKKAGFEINRNGPASVMVYSSPAVFYFTPGALENFFAYLSEILGDPEKVPEDLKRKSLATLACKKSIKAGDKLSPESALLIMEDLKKCEDGMHCPHGRPTMLELSLGELTKKFGRSSI